MPTVVADSKRRVVLPKARAGEVFDVQMPSEGRLLLVRLTPPEPPPRPTRAECLRRMDAAPLSPTLSWSQLKAVTREP